MVIFGVYFIVFMVYRGYEQAVFLASQRHLSLASGVGNTLVVTSVKPAAS